MKARIHRTFDPWPSKVGLVSELRILGMVWLKQSGLLHCLHSYSYFGDGFVALSHLPCGFVDPHIHMRSLATSTSLLLQIESKSKRPHNISMTHLPKA